MSWGVLPEDGDQHHDEGDPHAKGNNEMEEEEEEAKTRSLNWKKLKQNEEWHTVGGLSCASEEGPFILANAIPDGPTI